MSTPVFPDMTANYQATVAVPRIAAEQARLEAARQAEAEQQAQVVTQPPVVAQTAPVQATVTYALPTNEYKLYIYMHESGNDPKRWNSSGCVGLGQACPASKLEAVCPNLDYGCEDAFFTGYAQQRYGGWQGAYNFWLSNHWW